MSIGWPRELWVFVNGNQCMATITSSSRNTRENFPTPDVPWTMACSGLPLEPGDNEVAVATANNFFGWGLKLRLADLEGLHLAAK